MWTDFYEALSHAATSSLFATLVRPKSRGWIRLRSSDPTEHPLIDPKYYSHPDDVKVMLEGKLLIIIASQVSTLIQSSSSFNRNESIMFFFYRLTLSHFFYSSTECHDQSWNETSCIIIESQLFLLVTAVKELFFSNLAIRFAKETLDTPVLKQLLSVYEVKHPNCKDIPADGDSYLECLIMHSTQTIYHPAGTCKMGPASDPDAVVDPQLRYTK